jgi:NitT/TauT family transport system substrate-binding protein
MRFTRHFNKLVLLLILLTLLTACSGEKEPATIKVVFPGYLSNAPFFIAQEEGYFEEQGLTIEMVEIRRSSEAIPALAQGDVDVVGGALSAGLINAIARGANIKLVADKGQASSPDGCATMVMLASNQFLDAHPSMEPTEVKGALVGLNPTGFRGYWFELYLNEVGLSLDDVEIFTGEDAAQSEAIQEGTIDLMGAAEPWVTRVLQSGYGNYWVGAKDIVPGASYAMLWYGPSLLEDDPELGNRFMVGYLKGVRQYNLGKTDRNLDILEKHTELEKEFLQDACWVPINDDGMISTPNVVDFQEWALGNELLDKIITEELFWEPNFLDFANKELEKD